MRSYEGLFIFPPDEAAETAGGRVKGLEELIKKHQGAVTQKTELGRKPLGYPLKKFREGQILALDFQMEEASALEFRKALALLDGLLNFMVLLKKVRAEKKSSSKTSAVSAQPTSKPVSSRPPSSQGHQAVASH